MEMDEQEIFDFINNKVEQLLLLANQTSDINKKIEILKEVIEYMPNEMEAISELLTLIENPYERLEFHIKMLKSIKGYLRFIEEEEDEDTVPYVEVISMLSISRLSYIHELFECELYNEMWQEAIKYWTQDINDDENLSDLMIFGLLCARNYNQAIELVERFNYNESIHMLIGAMIASDQLGDMEKVDYYFDRIYVQFPDFFKCFDVVMHSTDEYPLINALYETVFDALFKGGLEEILLDIIEKQNHFNA